MTIPASTIVQVNPGVVSAGGNSLVLNGLFLTENTLMPTDSVLNFSSATAVKNFFGASSTEYAIAQIYFAGFVNSTIKPTSILFAPYNSAARAAWLQGGSMVGVSLTTLQGYTGVLSITVNGSLETSSTINLSAATSFTNAAALILAGFTSPTFTVAWNAVLSSFIFTSSTTGTSSTITVAGGSLAADLNLTVATGATLSQGAALDTPASAMNNVVGISQNWSTCVPLFEPSLSDKSNFAIWNQGQNGGNQYLIVLWDSDAQTIVQGSTECFGHVAEQAEYNGIMCVSGDPAIATSQTLMNLAVFVAGMIASINFQQTNGRITAAFKTSTLLVPTCANQQNAANLLANGYSFFGSYATANQGFMFLYNGNISGQWEWMDPFVNQIWMNSQFQLALLTLLTQITSDPYNAAGYSLIRSALADPIAAAINFGAIRTGVTLSQAQIAEVNQAAGLDISSPLQTQGYYLQILDPEATARQNRQTPIINFWYCDGGAIQLITMASIDIL